MVESLPRFCVAQSVWSIEPGMLKSTAPWNVSATQPLHHDDRRFTVRSGSLLWQYDEIRSAAQRCKGRQRLDARRQACRNLDRRGGSVGQIKSQLGRRGEGLQRLIERRLLGLRDSRGIGHHRRRQLEHRQPPIKGQVNVLRHQVGRGLRLGLCPLDRRSIALEAEENEDRHNDEDQPAGEDDYCRGRVEAATAIAAFAPASHRRRAGPGRAPRSRRAPRRRQHRLDQPKQHRLAIGLADEPGAFGQLSRRDTRPCPKSRSVGSAASVRARSGRAGYHPSSRAYPRR